MKNKVIRVLAIITIIPIVVITIGISILWNTYLLSNSLWGYLKRRGLLGTKRKGK